MAQLTTTEANKPLFQLIEVGSEAAIRKPMNITDLVPRRLLSFKVASLRRGFRLGLRHQPKLVLNVRDFPITDPDNVRGGTIPDEN